MKAIRYYGKRDIRFEEIPVPLCEPGGLLVRVESCAICGTDVKAWLVGDPRIPEGQVIGHEFVGRIVEVGSDVAGWAAGERVTMATSLSCGACGWCRSGFTNRCETLKPISRVYPGAFAEYIAIPPAGVTGGNTVKVPATMGEMAALAEPLSCVINAQMLAGVKRGDTVVVIGFGPMGALHVETARANGAVCIIATVRSDPRRRLAELFGLDAVIASGATDPVVEVMRLSGGEGVDVVIATAPSAAAQEQAFAMVRKGGMVNLFAGLPRGSSELKIDSRLIHYRELFVSGGSDSAPRHVRQAVELLAHGMISEKIITHRFPLERFFDGLAVMEKREGLKVLIKPGE